MKMGRFEYKYYIPLEFLDDLRHRIIPFLHYDFYTQQSSRKEYTVRSIYLDSRNLFTHNEKLDGVKSRKKFRIRSYNNYSDDSIVFLEIKRKEVDSISKDRVALLYSNLEAFLKTKDFSLLNGYPKNVSEKHAYARNFLFYYHLYNLLPSVIVTYEREAFECKFGSGLRVTIDKNVRTKKTDSYSGLFEVNDMVPSFKNCFALEIKFLKVLPKWISSALIKYNVRRISVPKYSWSVEAAHNSQFVKGKI
jgi:hypothetical protein